jgi:hypothetical protein
MKISVLKKQDSLLQHLSGSISWLATQRAPDAVLRGFPKVSPSESVQAYSKCQCSKNTGERGFWTLNNFTHVDVALEYKAHCLVFRLSRRKIFDLSFKKHYHTSLLYKKRKMRNHFTKVYVWKKVLTK